MIITAGGRRKRERKITGVKESCLKKGKIKEKPDSQREYLHQYQFMPVQDLSPYARYVHPQVNYIWKSHWSEVQTQPL